MRRSELIARIAALDYVNGIDFSPLVDRLLLPFRKGWTDIPANATKADFDLCKFDRRFSLIARPLIALTSDADPELAIAPGLVERGLIHNIVGANSGTLQNEFWQSGSMRRYSSIAGSKVGIKFNEDVAEAVRKIGLLAWPSISMAACLNRKNTDEIKRLGDVDVLAVTADGRQCWAIEAKDLKLCRSLGEIARRLSGYRGQLKPNGKPDELMKHLQRVNFLRTNATALAKSLKLSATPQIHGIVVVNSPQPMQQLRGEYSKDSTVVMFDDLDAVPWQTGWAAECKITSAAKLESADKTY